MKRVFHSHVLCVCFVGDEEEFYRQRCPYLHKAQVHSATDEVTSGSRPDGMFERTYEGLQTRGSYWFNVLISKTIYDLNFYFISFVKIGFFKSHVEKEIPIVEMPCKHSLKHLT